MAVTFAEIREILAERIREYFSTEQNRRDFRSAVLSLFSFLLFLFLATYGIMPSYMLLDRPGRAITVKFSPSPDPAVAELAHTRFEEGQPAPRVAPAQPPKSDRPYRLETLTSMAASRPDYFGKQPLMPPVQKDRPEVSDAPERWADRPAPKEHEPSKSIHGTSAVQMPSPKIGTSTGVGEVTSEISFDVPESGGSKGADFITLSSRTRPSSVGQPGGKEMSIRRPILRKPTPTIPEWFEKKGLDGFVTFRIVVSASGKVESAEVEKTIGYKEIDADAREYVLQWLFEPTGFRETLIVKFRYVLR